MMMMMMMMMMMSAYEYNYEYDAGDNCNDAVDGPMRIIMIHTCEAH